MAVPTIPKRVKSLVTLFAFSVRIGAVTPWRGLLHPYVPDERRVQRRGRETS